MFCPICGDEYRPGFETCARCEVPLAPEPPPPPPEPPAIAVAARFRDLPEGELAWCALQAAELPSDLLDRNIVGLCWTYSNAIGGLRLRVSETDLESAREVLAGRIEASAGDEEDASVERCANCRSTDLAIDKGSRKTIALWLMFPLPFPVVFWRTRLVCRSCGTSRVVPGDFRLQTIARLAACTLAFAGLSVAVLLSFALVLSIDLSH